MLSRALVANVAALALVGCLSPQVVGENKPETQNQSTLVEQTGDGTACQFPAPTEATCASSDESNSSGHKAWACAPNQLGTLAGTEWRLESGPWTSVPAYTGNPLTLRFGADGKSTFEVGTPVAPIAELGHLCRDRAGGKDYCSLGWKQQFPLGAVYPLHGISHDGDGWTLPFRAAGYLDEWCGLQTPRVEDACSFNLIGNNGSLFGPLCTPGEECGFTFDGPDGGLYGTACSIGNASEDGTYHVVEEVDCRWLMLAGIRTDETCSCNSANCFPSATANDTEWSLTLSEEGEVLLLTAGEEEQSFRRVH